MQNNIDLWDVQHEHGNRLDFDWLNRNATFAIWKRLAQFMISVLLVRIPMMWNCTQEAPWPNRWHKANAWPL
jgi:hypothetical protein